MQADNLCYHWDQPVSVVKYEFYISSFSLTLVDSLDTLIILGDFEEFEDATRLVIRDVSFDKNIVVSVFETNIRMLG